MMKHKSKFMRAIKDMFFGIGGDPGPDQGSPAGVHILKIKQ
jgi:hypothetical protein